MSLQYWIKMLSSWYQICIIIIIGRCTMGMDVKQWYLSCKRLPVDQRLRFQIPLVAEINFCRVLVLQVYSAHSDTVDHDVLLQHLEKTFGFSDSLLQWIRSYLGNRSQSVSLNGKTNVARPIICGVPQESVLGHFFLHYIQLTSVILVDHMDFIIMHMLMTIRVMHPVHHQMPWS